MIKIIQPKIRHQEFGELVPGDTFRIENLIHIKIVPVPVSNYQDGISYNAFCLNTNEFKIFDNTVNVIPVEVDLTYS